MTLGWSGTPPPPAKLPVMNTGKRRETPEEAGLEQPPKIGRILGI